MSARKTKTTRSSGPVRSEISFSGSFSGSTAGEDSFQSILESSRSQEKEQLTGLNSRLATYIDKVRQLEAENNRLTVQIKDIEIVEKKERNNLAERFEAERARLRNALEDAREQAAKYAVERDSAIAEHERLATKVAKLERDLKKSEEDRLSALSLAESSTAKQKNMQNRLDKAEGDVADLEKELARLRMQLAALQKNLEDESVLRAAANAKIQALTEDLEFQKKQHKSALEEVRHKRQVDMTTYAKQINDEYQSKLQDQLAEMRARFQSQLAASKGAFEEAYKNKLNDARELAEAAHDEAARMRIRVHELEKSGSTHDTVIEGLRRELADMKDELDRARRSWQERLDSKELRIAELNREIQRMMEEFHNLLDLKIQLDTELNTYRMLLESEETRLNISGGQSRDNSMTSHHVSYSSGSGSGARGLKRARVEWNGDEDLDFHRLRQKLHKHVDGPVGIDEIDPNGQWVRISNSTDEEVSIAHWKLLVRAGGKEVTYQFNTRMKLDPHGHATVYSADSGEKHRPPTDFVMKKQNWPIGDNPSVRLEDHEGDLRSSVTFESDESTDPSDPAERCSIIIHSQLVTFSSVAPATVELIFFRALRKHSHSCLASLNNKRNELDGWDIRFSRMKFISSVGKI
ncbi:intermediate filament tail domain protein [Ancylostoma ceylanicum]|uniref:Intermediate filament tail domain protein n=1 Tax=Ancylostoma ceylanicum TaxID=53326 RepID=A0A0D6LNZ2_9BILA|nr:intermediate filament tail domain protein [Ancylostoma ceylanicum]